MYLIMRQIKNVSLVEADRPSQKEWKEREKRVLIESMVRALEPLKRRKVHPDLLLSFSLPTSHLPGNRVRRGVSVEFAPRKAIPYARSCQVTPSVDLACHSLQAFSKCFSRCVEEYTTQREISHFFSLNTFLTIRSTIASRLSCPCPCLLSFPSISLLLLAYFPITSNSTLTLS